jgi:hypothetical protein
MRPGWGCSGVLFKPGWARATPSKPWGLGPAAHAACEPDQALISSAPGSGRLKGMPSALRNSSTAAGRRSGACLPCARACDRPPHELCG